MPIFTLAAHSQTTGNGGLLPARSFSRLIVFVFALLLLCACGLNGQTRQTGQTTQSAQSNPATTKFQLASSAFSAGGMIPKQFSCEGTDGSPQLNWSGVPSAAHSLALIMDDPDAPAGTWVHWVLYNLPASAKELAEGVEKQEQLADGTLQGRNSFGKAGYGGPCPPPGNPHRYFFKIYALDLKLDLKAGASKDELEQAMKGHILGQAELIGKYGR
jgi:Raf kinase inhibitor-like YbhB/YbcL family protein